ncbi:superoxide dismutase family protein [Planomonospora sp. ID67723]|uniref:superoxide dismutase family protein n=1 Tax=Planomonospora sp. ID67723 TaxID=2738134 RepID=UPI0018C425AD|nr:superoxide dismutase family protein [Planomonospora sp. ID67723]MBG0832500.1 superoxide dismutase family protein [Planomonospora sp. ID67723]
MRLPVVLSVAALLAAACGTQQAAHPVGHPPAKSTQAAEVRLAGEGRFGAPATGGPAIAYDGKLVPRGASARVTAVSGAVLATSTVVVEGFLPDRTYGVHLHVNPCGADPEAAGPHYRHVHTHASADNEVWLDFTTDSEGAATATSRQDWAFPPGKAPRSMVIHAQRTKATGAKAGTAGPRVACVTLGEG